MFERYLTSWDRDDIFSKEEHGLGSSQIDVHDIA